MNSGLKWGLIVFIIGLFSGIFMRTNAGEIRTDSLRSVALNRVWKFHVYLPAHFDSSGTHLYPVIYGLHGSGGTMDDWDRAYPLLDSLINAEVIPPVIVVAPGSGTSWWVDGKEPYETAFFEDFFPYVEQKYPVVHNRESRIVAGFSMGGYSALRYALVHPDLFGGAILLSPALYNEQPPEESSARSSGSFGNPFSPELWSSRNYPAVLPDYLSKNLPVYFFIAAGDDDWNNPEGVQYNMERQVVLLYQTLHKQHDIPADLRIVNGGHNWKIWLPLLAEGLENITVHLSGFALDGTR